MAFSTIDKSTDYFNTVLYTGNDTARTITTDLTSTDFIWNKRTDSTGNHMLFDAVRGINKEINSDSTEAEETQVGTVTAFGSNSYTLGTHGATNYSGETRASWNWSANGAGSTNTDGDITSTVSVNTTAGFSIVKFNTDGQSAASLVTCGHGLGTVPKMMIFKFLPTVDNWYTYHNEIGNAKYMVLNTTAAEASNANVWSTTSPTSSVFSLNTNFWGVSANNIIAYCFADVAGYSKMGSYIGTGNVDGAFVYTGFAPAFVIFKNTAGTSNWEMENNKMPGYNVINK